MLALSDSQFEQLKTLAAPLHPRWRGAFLREVAAQAGDRGELGDGELYQIALRARQVTMERALTPRRRGTAAAVAVDGRA